MKAPSLGRPPTGGPAMIYRLALRGRWCASAPVRAAATGRGARSGSSSRREGRGPAAGGRPQRGPPSGGDRDDDEEDRYFVSDAAAKKLRSIIKREGLSAIADEDGYGRVPLEELEREPKGRRGRGNSSSSRSRAGREEGDGGGGDGGREQQPRRRSLFNAGSGDDDGQDGNGDEEGGDESNGGGRAGSFYDSGKGAWVLDTAAAENLRKFEERLGDRGGGGGRGGARGGRRGEASQQRERGGRPASDRGGRGAAAAPAPAAVPAPAAFTAATAAAVSAQIPVVRTDPGPDKGTFFSGSSWRDLGASDEVVAALKSLGISRPSHIQTESFKVLLPPKGPAAAARHVALADQAGSGKTLAYLLPLLQELREEERKAGKPVTVPGSPRVLIVAPTGELAQQVQRVLRALVAAGLRFRSSLMTGGQEDEGRRFKALRTQREALKAGVDVVVATPGRAVALLDRGDLDLSATRAVVLDEVDVLCGAEDVYREQVEPLQAAAPQTTRFVLVSATLPSHTFEKLREVFPGLEAAFGPGLHRVSAGVVEELVDCSGGDEITLETGVARKLQALSAALDRHGAQRVVVFCNKVEACRAVENHLKRKHGRRPAAQGGGGGQQQQQQQQWGASGDEAAAPAVGLQAVDVYAYHEGVSEPSRQQTLATFLSPTSPAAPQRPVVLVCTDRTSRGIDSVYCEHVVLFDFPRDPSEYVRRAGRTARGAGGRGVVSVLVLGKQVPLAREIIDQNQKGRPVHAIPEAADWGQRW